MKIEKRYRWFLGVSLLASLFLIVGCEEGPKTDVEVIVDSPQLQLRKNALEGLPGEVYRSQVDSAIDWQPWTEETLQLADKEERLVFAVIVMPQQPGFKKVLAEMQENQAIVNELNSKYVPILIDGNAIREMSLLTVDLCAEIKVGLQLPLMLWMTSEGNPVAWIPLSDSKNMSLEGLFMQSHSMVWNVWENDPDYVYSNSRLDQLNRAKRIKERMEYREVSDEPELDAVWALRQLTAVYDPVSRTLDQAGGLFPVGTLELLSMSAQMDGLSNSVREKSKTVLGHLVSDLVPSAMFDPLDGGVFSSKLGNSWNFPQFYRDAATQAQVVSSLMNAYAATGDERAKERALGVISFAEENFKSPEGLFSLGSEYRGAPEKWLWQMEEVRQLLSEEELDVWVKASGIEKMGNIPLELDPLRRYVHANSFRNAKSAEEIAEAADLDTQSVKDLLSSARRKLLKAREERLNRGAERTEPDAVASFQMARAYAAAFQATGDEMFRKNAVKTMESAKAQFSDGPRLKVYPGEAPRSLVTARAFVYALAINACLDVAAVTSEESWLFWADDLATTTAEIFIDGEILLECPPEVKLTDLPVSDSVMVFGDSTIGLFSQAEARMSALDRPIGDLFETVNKGLPVKAMTNPVVYTDQIQAALIRGYGGDSEDPD